MRGTMWLGGQCMQMTRITRRGNARGCTIPAAYLVELGWKEGDWVALGLSRGAVQIMAVTAISVQEGEVAKVIYSGGSGRRRGAPNGH